jgi:hypothetical protein
VLVFVLYQFTLCGWDATTAAEPSLIALVNVSTPLAALVNPNNFKPPDIILAAFQKLQELKDLIKTPPKYSPNGLTTLNSPWNTPVIAAVTLASFCEPASVL